MKNLKKCRINVMISNMDKAITFYTDTLGLELLNRYGNHYAEVQAADLMIGLHPASNKTKTGNNLSIGFGVGDFDATLADLTAEGINFTIEDEGWVRLAYFTDPDQNQLYIAENKD